MATILTDKKISLFNVVLLALLFLLPLQTQWIMRVGELGGVTWEFGTIRLFATAFIAAVVLLWSLGTRRVFHISAALSVLLLLIVASVIWAPHHLVAAQAALSLIIAVVLFALFKRVSISGAHLRTVFILGVAVQAVIGIIEVLMQIAPAVTSLGMAIHLPATPGSAVIFGDFGRFLRAYGGLPHPNILGGLTAGALVLLLGRPVALPRFGKVIVSFILSAGLFLSFSRTAMIAFGAALIIMAAQAIFHRRAVQHFWLSAGACIIALVLGSVIFWAPLSVRVAAVGPLETLSLSNRRVLYDEAAALFTQKPFFGWGIGNFTYASFLRGKARPVITNEPVHNIFYLIAVELGAIGLIVWLVAVWGEITALSRLSDKLIIIVFLGTLAVFDHYLWSLWIGVAFFWIFIALWQKDFFVH